MNSQGRQDLKTRMTDEINVKNSCSAYMNSDLIWKLIYVDKDTFFIYPSTNRYAKTA